MPHEYRVATCADPLAHRGMDGAGRPTSAGFSLVELMVVMAIALVVTAFAIPTLTTTMDGVRIRGALGSASNIAQRCRMQAVKRNTPQRLHFSQVGGNVALFVTDSTDAAVAPLPTDKTLWAQYWLASQFTIPGVPSGAGAPPVLTNTQMWGTSTVNLNVNTDPYFNSRGIPCQPVAGAGCTNNGGFVYYYRYRNGGRARWAATSISPAGRIESWIWNGTAWGN
jgi:prepilin-type N-terminal cleavage/methylation domain-containing protein